MGRKSLPPNQKKKTLTINIDIKLYEEFEKLDIKNKSKFFDWLLQEHFNFIKEK